MRTSTRRRTGFFPSLAATLNHILVVDWFYVDALEGGWLGRAAFADEVALPDGRSPCKLGKRPSTTG